MGAMRDHAPDAGPAGADDPAANAEGLDGAALLSWARLAEAELQAQREELNALNVFPVPDSDTGSNMAATMSAAVDAADGLPDGAAAGDVAAALADGAVLGARGNSGTVLSQVLRALAVPAADRITGADIRHALTHAVTLVDEAIAEPVEGTILTVLRAAATAAADEDSDDAGPVVQAAATAAREALAETPSQLPALKEAGVVDAGGAGLTILLDVLTEAVGNEAGPRVGLTVGDGAGGHGVGTHHGTAEPAADPAELEVMFRIDCRDDAAAALRTRLAELGTSLIIGADTHGVRTVHVHTTAAGSVIEAALQAGRPTDIRIEPVFAQGTGAVAGPPDGGDPAPRRAVIAVTPDGPLAELFAAAGAIPVAPGAGAVARIGDAIAAAPGGADVMVLPNGMLGARELVEVELRAHTRSRALTIVATPSPANGLAALAVHDADLPPAIDAYAMSEASSGMRTAELIVADGPGLTMAGPCRRGDVLAIVSGDIVAVGRDADEACATVVDLMLRSGGEMVTLLLGGDADPESAATLRAHLAHSAPGVDVTAYDAAGIEALLLVGVE